MTQKKTAVPAKTPRVFSDSGAKKTKFEDSMYQRNLFISMSLNMSWQLAIVVIIPLVGGFKLDERLDSSPLYTLLGLALAFCLTILVMRRVLVEAKDNAGFEKKDGK